MTDFKVNPVQSLDVYSLRKVINTSRLSDYQKVKFIRENSTEVRTVLKRKLSPDEYNMLVANRPLQSFKPIKNSFTKRGDKVLLAQALNIGVKDVDGCITKAAEAMKGNGNLDGFSKDAIDTMRAYVYRHGTKQQLMMFLDTELASSKNISKTLQKNLEYKMGGIADYFMRPIHRLDNSSLVNIYKIIDNNIAQAQLNGKLSELEANRLSQWALQKIYIIQNNQKLANAVKLTKQLEAV